MAQRQAPRLAARRHHGCRGRCDDRCGRGSGGRRSDGRHRVDGRRRRCGRRHGWCGSRRNGWRSARRRGWLIARHHGCRGRCDDRCGRGSGGRCSDGRHRVDGRRRRCGGRRRFGLHGVGERGRRAHGQCRNHSQCPRHHAERHRLDIDHHRCPPSRYGLEPVLLGASASHAKLLHQWLLWRSRKSKFVFREHVSLGV